MPHAFRTELQKVYRPKHVVSFVIVPLRASGRRNNPDGRANCIRGRAGSWQGCLQGGAADFTFL